MTARAASVRLGFEVAATARTAVLEAAQVVAACIRHERRLLGRIGDGRRLAPMREPQRRLRY